MSDGPVLRHWRRLLRFSMRSLIILVLVIGGGMGWLVRSARLQRAAVAAITSAGGTVEYDWQASGAAAPSWLSGWLAEHLGTDYFGHVSNVWLYGTLTQTDEVLTSVSGLTRLERLGVTSSSVTDSGLAHLRGMTSLSRLDLAFTKITDAGLVHLKGLSGLSVLVLNGTRITDAGLAHLEGLRRLLRAGPRRHRSHRRRPGAIEGSDEPLCGERHEHEGDRRRNERFEAGPPGPASVSLSEPRLALRRGATGGSPTPVCARS